MATSFGELPGLGAAPTSSVAGSPAASLIGGTGAVRQPEASTPSPDASQQEVAKAFMDQVRKIQASIEDLARQHPAFAPFARKMKDAAVEGMMRVVSEQRGKESPAPGLIG